MRFVTLLWGAALVIVACSAPPVPAQPQDLAIARQWAGLYPVAVLDRLPAGQRQSATGYFGDMAGFAAAWAEFKPDEVVPEVDFAAQIVVFSRNITFFNRTNILRVTLTDGVAEILAMETMSAIPIEAQVAMAMAIVPRAGVRFIQSRDQRIPVE